MLNYYISVVSGYLVISLLEFSLVFNDIAEISSSVAILLDLSKI